MSSWTRNRGLTVLEMLVSIAVSIIITVSAIPAYKNFIKASARSTASLDLYRAMIVARSEAIARNRDVIVCRRDPASDPAFPQCVMSATTEWNDGWIVFADSTNLFAATEPDRVEDIIVVFNGAPNQIDVNHDLGSDLYVAFDGSGRSYERFEFRICDIDAELDGRRVSVSPAGTVTLRETTCAP